MNSTSNRTFALYLIKSRSKEEFDLQEFLLLLHSAKHTKSSSDAVIYNLYPCTHPGVFYEKPKNYLLAEYGSTFFDKTFSPYLGAYLNSSFRNALDFGLLIGSSYDFNGIAMARVRYNLYSLGLGSKMYSVCIWDRPKTTYSNYWVAKLYLGLEKQSELFTSKIDFNENNINLGIEFENFRPKSRFSRFFIQYGARYQYNSTFIDDDEFGYLRFGGAIRLLSKKTKN